LRLLDTVLEVRLWFQIPLISTDSNESGRYTFDLAFENIIKVAVVSHPSLLNVPEDLEVRIVYFFVCLFLHLTPLSSFHLPITNCLVSPAPCLTTRNTPPRRKCPSSLTRAPLINNFHSSHLLKPMRSLEVASLPQDTRGNTSKDAVMVLLSVAI
jgi:hypothetical protein